MKRLGVYLMAGRETPALAEAAVAAGADLLELGLPFSDPLADGPVIRHAAERALAGGVDTAAGLRCLAEVRARVDVPLVPMTYAAVLEARGPARFAAEAREAGADALIVADLPVDAWPEIRRVQLVAPTTPADRLRIAGERTDGWLYLVARIGTTGPRDGLSPDLPPLVRRARSVTGTPLLAGFGISTPGPAAQAAELADGVIVGSAALLAVERGGPAALTELVASLRGALDEVASVGSPG